MHLNFDSPRQVVAALEASANPSGLWLLCVVDRHADRLQALLDELAASGIDACGGIFPGLIHGARHLDHGLLAVPLPPGSQVATADLSQHSPRWLQPRPLDQGPASTLAFVDCQAPGIAGFLEALFDQYGNQVRQAGGGAGFRDLRASPSIFCGRQLLPQAGLLILLPRQATVQVRHGWRRVRGPFVATRTRGNVIQELNWEPAGRFYRNLIGELAPELGDRPVFPDLNSIYPLCIGKEGGEDVMRDPIDITADDEIVVLSDVPENSVMYLAHGNRDTLVAAAGQAVADCGRPPGITSCFVSDCYSRALMLGNQFTRELDCIDSGLREAVGIPAEGVLALGEIASDGRRSLEFYNKTTVIALQHG